MTRSIWKGPFVDPNLIKKVDKLKSQTVKPPIKTWSRKCTIIPEFVGVQIGRFRFYPNKCNDYGHYYQSFFHNIKVICS